MDIIQYFHKLKDYINGENGNNCILLTTLEEFIQTKGDKNNNIIKVKVLCSCKENTFEVSFDKFKYRNKKQCNKCGLKSIGKKLRKSNDLFLLQFKEVTKNNFLLIKPYQNANTDIEVLHKKCNHSFFISPNNFLKKPMCRICETCSSLESLNYHIYEKCDNNYKVLEEYKGFHIPISILHINCGGTWNCSPSNLLRYYKKTNTCPKCSKISKGEDKIKQFLISNNINFKTQFKFKDCKKIRELRFDFAILDKNNNLDCLIEYDGEQHYRLTRYVNKESMLKENQENDKIKSTYCQDHNIKLIRIPYWDLNKIEQILSMELEVM